MTVGVGSEQNVVATEVALSFRIQVDIVRVEVTFPSQAT